MRKPLMIITLFVVISIAATTAVLLFIRSEMREQAVHATLLDARMMLDRIEATYGYVASEMRPAIRDNLLKPFNRKDHFDPRYMSNHFMMGRIQERFRNFGHEEIYINSVAINARTPAREADAFERAFLQTLDSPEKVSEKHEVRMLGHTPYLILMRPGPAFSEQCMLCHSTPEVAPAELVSIYGSVRAFGKKVGTVSSVYSVRIPLATVFAKIDRTVAGTGVMITALLLTLAGLAFAVVKYTLISPIEQAARAMENQGRSIPPAPDTTAASLKHLLGLVQKQISSSGTEIQNLQESLENAEVRLSSRKQKYHALADFQEDAIFHLTPNLTITFINRSCHTKFMLPDHAAVTLSNIIPIHEIDAVTRVLKSLAPDNTSRQMVINHAGIHDTARWFRWTFRAIFSDDGQVKQYHGFGTDITEVLTGKQKMEALLKEKDSVIRSLHAETKSNLQELSALLEMYSEEGKFEHTVVGTTLHRIRVMAMAHDVLHHTGQIREINLDSFLRTLITQLAEERSLAHNAITLLQNYEPFTIDKDFAVNCGIIMTELFDNAVRHAFPGHGGGNISLGLVRHPANVTLTVADNGVGIDPAQAEKRDELVGLGLVRTLVNELDGTMEITSLGGTVVTITLPY